MPYSKHRFLGLCEMGSYSCAHNDDPYHMKKTRLGQSLNCACNYHLYHHQKKGQNLRESFSVTRSIASCEDSQSPTACF